MPHINMLNMRGPNIRAGEIGPVKQILKWRSHGKLKSIGGHHGTLDEPKPSDPAAVAGPES